MSFTLHGLGVSGGVAIGLDGHFRTFAGRQHHHAHDAFGVDAARALAHPDLAFVLAGKLGQLGGCPGVQAQFVDDFGFLGQHGQ